MLRMMTTRFILSALSRSGVRPTRLYLPALRQFIHDPREVSSTFGEIFTDQIYRPVKPLRPGSRVVDVGAHYGLFAIYMLRMGAGDVSCYEPNPASFAILQRNLAGYRNEHHARIETINAAVCEKKGRVRLFVPRSSVAARVMPDSYIVRDPDCVDVTAITIEEAVGPGCDFLKLDAEGVEYDLLPNAICRPDRIGEIAVEFHDIEKRFSELDEILALLTKRGYRPYGNARAEVVHFA